MAVDIPIIDDMPMISTLLFPYKRDTPGNLDAYYISDFWNADGYFYSPTENGFETCENAIAWFEEITGTAYDYDDHAMWMAVRICVNE
jgi:hypothetical protein